MKRMALVAVSEEPEAFAPLFAAARQRGVRIGWLDLADRAASAEPVLGRAADLGAARAVAAGGGRVVAVKPVAGAPVLRDLVREHFAGCPIVLVRGREGRPALAALPDGRFRVSAAAGRELDLDAAAALARLLLPAQSPALPSGERAGGHGAA